MDFLAGKLSNAREVEIQHAAIKDLVEKQAAAGFKAVTDGEFSRQYWHLDFLWGLTGVDKLNNVKYERNFKGNINTADNVTLTALIAENPHHPFYDAFEYLKSVAPAGTEPKFTIPSPGLLFRDHRSDNWQISTTLLMLTSKPSPKPILTRSNISMTWVCATCKSMTPTGLT